MSTAGTTRIINIVLAMRLTSPSPRQVHNNLSREGRDLLWLFSNPLLLFFSLLLTEISCRKGPWQQATCALQLGDRCIFHLANVQPEHQHQQLVKYGDHFVTNQTAVAAVVTQSLWGFPICRLECWLCVAVWGVISASTVIIQYKSSLIYTV